MTAMLPIINGFFDGESGNSENSSHNGAPQVSTEELQQLEENLLIVLDREPNNPNALQNLTRVRLEMGNLEGAIEPLDQLITLFPEDQVLKDLKEQLEQNLARTSPPSTPTDATPSETPESPATDPKNATESDSEVEASPAEPPSDPETPAAE